MDLWPGRGGSVGALDVLSHVPVELFLIVVEALPSYRILPHGLDDPGSACLGVVPARLRGPKCLCMPALWAANGVSVALEVGLVNPHFP